MEIGNPAVVAPKKGDRIASPVGMMAGVQAEQDPLGIGLAQQPFDLVLVFHVGFGVRMENHLQAEPFPDQVHHVMNPVDQPLPGLVVQLPGSGGLARPEIGIGVVDQDQVFGAQIGQGLPRAQDLLLQARPGGMVFQVSHGEGAGSPQAAL